MIQDKYLLVIMIPCYVGSDGRRFVDELWHKDLVKHLDHIADLRLAAPARAGTPEGISLPVDAAGHAGSITHIDLPPCRSTLAALVTLPAAAARLWKAIGEADILHANVGGWPISYGWVAVPMARLRGKFVLTNVESAGWRMGLRRPFRLKGLIQGLVFEVMARFCVNLSDLVTFTQAGYRDEMLWSRRRHRGHVVSASWIEEGQILSDDQAGADWAEKLKDPGRPLRAVFAGGLLASKGVDVLLRALEILDRRGTALALQVYGAGPLYDACLAAAGRLKGSVAVEVRGKLAYGPAFFEMLRGQDVMLIPSVSDEQPRVVFDCFSQALPVVASDTTGLRQCVDDGRNGLLVPAGDPEALADAVTRLAGDRGRLRDLGVAGLEAARALTHDKMHLRRAEIIRSAVSRRVPRLA